MRLEQILSEYSKDNSIVPEFQLNEEGKCFIGINDKETVAFEHALGRNGYYCYAAIGKVPLEKEKEVFLVALEGNLFGLETGLAHIGYAKTERLLVLFQYFEEDNVNYEQFKQQFKEFTDYLLHWDQKFKGILEEPTDKTPLNIPSQKEGSKTIFFA